MPSFGELNPVTIEQFQFNKETQEVKDILEKINIESDTLTDEQTEQVRN